MISDDFIIIILVTILFPSSLESRPLSMPLKVMMDTTAEEAWTSSEERVKELIGHAWDAVKRLTLQVSISSLSPLFISWCLILPYLVLFTRNHLCQNMKHTSLQILSNLAATDTDIFGVQASASFQLIPLWLDLIPKLLPVLVQLFVS